MPLRTSTGQIIYLPADAPASGPRFLWELVPGLPKPKIWIQPRRDILGYWSPTTFEESCTNVANPGTYNAAPGTAPAWAAATGWTFTAASSQYLTTGLTPTKQVWSLLVCFSGATTTAARCPVGMLSTTGRFYLYSADGGTNHIFASGGTVTVAPALTAGALAIAGAQGYLNGAANGGAIGDDAATTLPLFIGARNGNGTPGVYFDGVEALVAVWDSDIAAYIAALQVVLVAAGLTT